MKVRADTEVAVLSARNDLDLAISTWLPGYCAQRTDDLDTVVDVTRRGGVVLIDLGTPRHEEWVSALQDRGFDGPIVFLDPRGDVTLDLSDRVVVPWPPSLSGLLSGFEMARSQQPAQPRRRSARDQATATGRARRRSPAPPETTARVELETVGQEPGAQGAVRARRVDRRKSATGKGSWGPRRRRATAPTPPTTEIIPPPPTSPATSPPTSPPLSHATSPPSDADAEREFRKAFCAADAQPGVHRVTTPEGRVRIQTEEELFAEHASAPPLAHVLTLPTAAPRRQRRARASG